MSSQPENIYWNSIPAPLHPSPESLRHPRTQSDRIMFILRMLAWWRCTSWTPS